MKKIINKLLLMALLFAATITKAQTPVGFREMNQLKPYWQFAPRIGYDIPTYDNNTRYIDYKGGIDLGLSADYYWSWFGLGADFDFIKNKPQSIYPTIIFLGRAQQQT
ncbi:MAG: hypothetical protein WDM90_13870 [Ferruginibacter sp.]